MHDSGFRGAAHGAAPVGGLLPYVMTLIGVSILAISVFAGLIAGAATQAGASNTTAREPSDPDPVRVVLMWDRSFRVADCETFKATTTAEFRADYGQARADYSTCAGFREGLKEIEYGKPDDFWRTYRIEIIDVQIGEETARIETKETWEYLDGRRVRTTSDTYTYHLVLVEGQWLIDDASFLHRDGEYTV